jgi:hypothetical protein
MSDRTCKRKKTADDQSKRGLADSPERKKGARVKNTDVEGLKQIEDFYLDNPDFSAIPFTILKTYLSSVKRLDPHKTAKQLLVDITELLNTLVELDTRKVVREQALRNRIHRLVAALQQ